MARTCLIEKEKRRDKLINKFSSKLKELKKLISNLYISSIDRYKLQKEIQKIPRNASSVRRRNRCLISGRPRGVFRQFGVSRMIIRDLAFNGKIPGIYKACW